AWLLHVAWQAWANLYKVPPGNPLPCLPGCWYALLREPLAAAWLLVLALIAAGSPWSRVAVGAALLLRVVDECVDGRLLVEFSPPLSVEIALGVSLPLLPLLVLRVNEPRIVVALLARGRWRDALVRSGGLRTALVAAALVSTDRGVRA